MKEFYDREKNIVIASELLRVINKIKIKARLGKDISKRYDRKLSQIELKQLEDELKKFKTLYDALAGEKGSFDRKYEIEGQIAEGGMSKIFKGIRKSDGAPIAIKFLLEKFFDNKRIVARFHRESGILLKIDHPNVVKLYERGEYEGKYFIIMEYVDGGSLDQLIGQPSLSFSLALDVIKQVCKGLQFVHGKGIIHRDIKPGNVLLKWVSREAKKLEGSEAEVVAKLTDFGLAKEVSVDDFTKEYTTMGTPYYVSPEQRLSPKDVDHRTDIYSLGIMMYEMLSGGSYPVGNYKKLHEINPEIPVEIDAIVEKCKKEKPDDRWNSAHEVYEALNIFSSPSLGT